MRSGSAEKRTLISVLSVSVFIVLAVVLLLTSISSADEPTEEIQNFNFQTVSADSIESESTGLRFLFTVGSLHYTRVGFVFSKTNENPTVGGNDCKVVETNVVYSTILADGKQEYAPDGRYWVAVKLNGITNDCFDAPIYISAFVEDNEGVRYSAAKNVTVCRAFGNEANANAFVPVIRFLVASDVHYADDVGVQDEKFETMLDDAYDYSDGHAKYQALDAAIIVGDIAHRGTETSLNRFFVDFYRWTREGTEAQALLGNHEFKPDKDYTVSRYLAASGYADADRHIVISGYHFILMSPSQYEGFNDEKISWLSTELAVAAADDPTGKKPIFVFQHHPAYDTVYGSEDEWGVTNLGPVFSLYPQVVDFSGHSHFPISDPRSVWQDEYTVFNTGSCREFGMDIVGLTTKTVFAKDAFGAWTYDEFPEDYLFDPGKYYIVEVNAANRVLVRAFDVGTGNEVIEPIFLSSVGDPSRFAYTDDRATAEASPRFAPDAEVTPITVSAFSATFSFPRTVSGGYVQNYRCEVKNGEGQLIDTVYRLDCGFLFPAPESLKLPLSNLTPETDYTVSIVPVTTWGNEGEPLEFVFSTTAVPDRVFSAVFGENGTATDQTSGMPLRRRGDPTTVLDDGDYYAVFDGNDAFEFDGITSFYPYMTSSFTFETYLCMDAKPNSGYVAPFANEESGGFGFEYKSNRQMDFWAFIDGDYRNVGKSISTGVWVHLVATYDGNTLILYENGVQVAAKSISGTVEAPDAQNLSIGADSSKSGSEAYAKCSIKVANVYRIALSADEVADLYAALTE